MPSLAGGTHLSMPPLNWVPHISILRCGHRAKARPLPPILATLYNPPVAASFPFAHSIPFSPESATEVLRAIPALPGVFAAPTLRIEGMTIAGS